MSLDVILASASPRRKELLKTVFEDFAVCPSNVDESLPDGIAPENAPVYLAEIKAKDIAENSPNSLVIGADTIVLAERKILGKPKNMEEAKEMLKMLSGKVHKVITGCALCYNGDCSSFSATTEVEFYSLTEKEIDDYIVTNEPFDKAGGYGIQSKGALLVKGIHGDYFNVVGLPISALSREINKICK